MSEYDDLVNNMVEEDIPDIDDPDAEVPDDELPDIVYCQFPECNEQLVYIGRGRKPKYCADHKGGKAVNAVTRNSQSRVTGANEKLAAQASEVLARINSLAALGIMAFGMPVSAMAIANANEEFKNNAYEALLLDAKLCQKILATGGKTAGLALFLAYGQLGMIVVPLAIEEIRAKRDKAEREALDNGSV